LPSQIVIPRPGGELVDVHRHNPLKPFHVVAAVRSAARKPEMQRGVSHSVVKIREGGTRNRSEGSIVTANTSTYGLGL
jgi:hypothetical protein